MTRKIILDADSLSSEIICVLTQGGFEPDDKELETIRRSLQTIDWKIILRLETEETTDARWQLFEACDRAFIDTAERA